MNARGAVRKCVLFVSAAVVCGGSSLSRAQYQQPRSYTDYYREQYQLTHAPPKTARNYTIDKYYYHNKNISPYSNLVRPSGYMPQYQAYVQPEVQRRARQQQAMGPRRMTPTYTAAPNYGNSAKMSAYSRKYGGYQSGP